MLGNAVFIIYYLFSRIIEDLYHHQLPMERLQLIFVLDLINCPADMINGLLPLNDYFGTKIFKIFQRLIITNLEMNKMTVLID